MSQQGIHYKMDSSMLNFVVCYDSIPPQQTEALKHLHRLIRKVRHVLVVKHCIDDLREAGPRRAVRNISSSKEASIISRGDIDLDRFSSDPPALPAAITIVTQSGQSLDTSSNSSSVSPLLQGRVPQAILKVGSIPVVERLMDRWIDRSYRWVQDCQQRVLSRSQNAWLSWARKRSSSRKDTRSRAILLKLLDEADQLQELHECLAAYISGLYIQAREGLRELVCRLSGVFGSGWFFEWPGGRHPLNSTWPWADVKPSLLVLWGVCWMFFPAPYVEQDLRGAYLFFDGGYDTFDEDAGLFGPDSHLDTAVSRQLLQAAIGTNACRELRPNRSFTLVRGSHSVSPTCQTYDDPCGALDFISQDGDFLRNLGPQDGQLETQAISSRGPNASRDYAYVSQGSALADQVNDTLASFQVVAVFLPPNQGLQGNQQHLNYRVPHQQSYTMPSENHYNYPPLDNLSALTDARPYMPHERDFQIPEYEQQLHDATQQEGARYPTPPVPMSDMPYVPQQQAEMSVDNRSDMPGDSKSDSDAASPGRSKPVPKPDREVTKDGNGKFICRFLGCTEEIKEFGRKCEWSKHMDKHERPYRCPAEGCEKLPGFTYSGGLLRHEREVHHKHGGPRKQLNCPHQNCKRHEGKGFSRQENLNEHLRRVHTGAEAIPRVEEPEENDVQVGQKRKRSATNSMDDRGEEIKRLRQENEVLRRQAAEHSAQIANMVAQIQQLQHVQQLQQHQHTNGHRMQPPMAQMT
ncbi:MAG: hypothetical protein M1818_004182 [Claussenomyces sp. TS43310]|nr:MAG: hypothetical protein M1818_004182 [Claussenomyces sp. TS43310]